MMLQRRQFGSVLAGLAGALWAGRWATGQTPTGSKGPVTERQLAPEGPLDRSAEALKSVLQDNQNQIKKNVQKLYQLAGELKDEVEKTDSAKVLSLNLVKKAEEAEKLAKQIKTLARS